MCDRKEILCLMKMMIEWNNSKGDIFTDSSAAKWGSPSTRVRQGEALGMSTALGSRD